MLVASRARSSQYLGAREAMPSKKPAKTNLAVGKPATYAGPAGRVQAMDDGRLLVSFDWASLPRPTNTLAVTCGRAQLADGIPTLQFGQIHPLRNDLTRLAVIRYDPQRFVDRLKDNAKFHEDVKRLAGSTTYDVNAMASCRRLENANNERCDAVYIDAEAEWMFCHNHVARFVAIFAFGRDIHRVTSRASDELPVQPVLEVTMPIQVLADVLTSWEHVVAEMKK